MTKEQWESLVGCPGWDAMKQFLMSRRMDVMEAIAGDHLVAQDREKAIRECIIYKELAELSWPQIARFYDIPLTPEPKENDAAERRP